VKARGDQAVREYTEHFDKVSPEEFLCSSASVMAAANQVPAPLEKAIDVAISNISAFHRSQTEEESVVETMPGIRCFRQRRPIERVGIYVPGGSAPLFSTLLMLAIPARIAGVRDLVLVTPPTSDGSINPVIALCARRLEINEIYLMGGAQAIGALAYGTETIRAVDKICGPGNQFVTEAKLRVSSEGIAIDIPAGPSEVLIIADEGARPDFVAADLLAQAEHGVDSDVVLVALSREFVNSVRDQVVAQLETLPRAAIAAHVMERSRAIVLTSVEDAIEFSNAYAPEHVILSVSSPDSYVPKVMNAGSVFLGYMAAESLGDYASGTNHVLPTGRFVTTTSGVSVDTFVRKITFQSVNAVGIASIGASVVEMARAEGLEAHARAVTIRQGGEQ
jgi:histidinol dehydrogenase